MSLFLPMQKNGFLTMQLISCLIEIHIFGRDFSGYLRGWLSAPVVNSLIFSSLNKTIPYRNVYLCLSIDLQFSLTLDRHFIKTVAYYKELHYPKNAEKNPMYILTTFTGRELKNTNL